MQDAPQNETSPPGGSGTGSLLWLAWTLFLLLVAYPLSVGPVAKVAGPDPPAVLWAIYAPLSYLNDHSQPVKSFFDWYAKVWGVRL
jgi:hypothetical protein